jgi:hypothetical protein
VYMSTFPSCFHRGSGISTSFPSHIWRGRLRNLCNILRMAGYRRRMRNLVHVPHGFAFQQAPPHKLQVNVLAMPRPSPPTCFPEITTQTMG